MYVGRKVALTEHKPFVRRYRNSFPGRFHTIFSAAERDRTRKAYISIRVIKNTFLAHVHVKQKQNAPRSLQVIIDVILLTLCD